MKRFVSIGAILVCGFALTACATGSVTALDPGYTALSQGDYAKARDVFAPALANSPNDPYLQVDLGYAYQGLGQMNLAAPLYRQALVDGQGVLPAVTTNSADAGRDLASIACQNLKAGMQTAPGC